MTCTSCGGGNGGEQVEGEKVALVEEGVGEQVEEEIVDVQAALLGEEGTLLVGGEQVEGEEDASARRRRRSTGTDVPDPMNPDWCWMLSGWWTDNVDREEDFRHFVPPSNFTKLRKFCVGNGTAAEAVAAIGWNPSLGAAPASYPVAVRPEGTVALRQEGADAIPPADGTVAVYDKGTAEASSSSSSLKRKPPVNYLSPVAKFWPEYNLHLPVGWTYDAETKSFFKRVEDGHSFKKVTAEEYLVEMSKRPGNYPVALRPDGTVALRSEGTDAIPPAEGTIALRSEGTAAVPPYDAVDEVKDGTIVKFDAAAATAAAAAAAAAVA